MIKGVGIDIVENHRIRENIENQRFIDKVLTPEEQTQFIGLSGERKVSYLAGRYAAKEAYLKALGTGYAKGNTFKDISVTNDENGCPTMNIPGHISISHEKENSIAIVILED